MTRTEAYDTLHKLLMFLLVQLLDPDQLLLRVVQACGELRHAVRESLEVRLRVVEKDSGGRSCFVQRRYCW